LAGLEDHLSAEGFGLLDVWMSHVIALLNCLKFCVIASSMVRDCSIANEEKAFSSLAMPAIGAPSELQSTQTSAIQQRDHRDSSNNPASQNLRRKMIFYTGQ